MTKSILNYNLMVYNDLEENEYIKRKFHQTRVVKAIKLIKEEIRDGSKIKILSIGCSTGVAEEMIAKATGATIFGIDGAPIAVSQARKRGIRVKLGDVADGLPYKNEEFDFVYAGEIIEHIFDTEYFLGEIYRVLKSKAFLILTTPNLARFDDRLKFLFGHSPRHTTPIHPYLNLHIRPFTFKSLKESLNKCGFNVVALRSNFVEFSLFRKIFYSGILADFFPSFGSTLIVKARKI